MLFQGLWQDYTVILSFGYLFWSTVLFTEITAFITQQLTADHCDIIWERRILATTKKSQSSLEKFSKYYEIYVNVRPASFFLQCVYAAAPAAKSLQSCPTLCDPIDGSPWGSSIPGILQARTLEWVAISFSNAWKWEVEVKLLSRVWLLATPWTAAHQAPPSMGFSRQECWSGVPLPCPMG